MTEPYPRNPQDVLDAWNEICPPAGFVRARMTRPRRKHLQARLKERKFCEDWREIFEKVAESDFLRGANNRGWKADFGWLIRNDDNYTKVMEGKYDNRQRTPRDTGSVPRPGQYDSTAAEGDGQHIDL